MILKKCSSHIRSGLILPCLILVFCGFVYPLVMTGIGQGIFSKKSNGSIVYKDGKPVGSMLVGQDFTDKRFMKCRPSAVNYNTYPQDDMKNKALPGKALVNTVSDEFSLQKEILTGEVKTGSDNYAPSNPKLKERVEKDIERFLKDNTKIKKEDLPADLFTSSGSGLDPHISLKSAEIQIPALVKATGLSKSKLEKIVDNNTDYKIFGIFGEETVNVLGVNLDILKTLE